MRTEPDLMSLLCGVYLAEVGRLRRRHACLRRRTRQLQRLRRFFSPAVADLVLANGDVVPRLRRADVSVVFFDLRGFTKFAQAAEPETIMSVLDDFHGAIGRLVHGAGGTIERFTGDGLMVFFNVPAPIDRPLEAAVRLTLAARERFRELAARWRAAGHELELGMGVSYGQATAGVIGFAGRRDYGVIGTVTNLAARLCQEARHSQILVPESLVPALTRFVDVEPVGRLLLKGFAAPVRVFDIVGIRDDRRQLRPVLEMATANGALAAALPNA